MLFCSVLYLRSVLGIAISPKQTFSMATCQSERLLQNKDCLSRWDTQSCAVACAALSLSLSPAQEICHLMYKPLSGLPGFRPDRGWVNASYCLLHLPRDTTHTPCADWQYPIWVVNVPIQLHNTTTQNSCIFLCVLCLVKGPRVRTALIQSDVWFLICSRWCQQFSPQDH